MQLPSHEPPGYSCPFCRVQGDDPEDPSGPPAIVRRYDDVFVLVNRKWWVNNPGAVMVIPNEHHENVFSMPPALGAAIQQAVRDTAIAMKAAWGCDGISTRQHNEPAGNQDVWHLHVHVFPRWEGDELYGSPSRRVEPAERIGAADELRAVWPSPSRMANVGAGAVLLDEAGRVLVVEPTYKSNWEIPGGAARIGESPLDACRREVEEELGLDLPIGPLLAFDQRTDEGAQRWLFAGPTMTPDLVSRIRLREDELRSFRFVPVDELETLTLPILARRVRAALRGEGPYLEDGVAPQQ